MRISKQHQNRNNYNRLNSLRKYYDCLIELGYITHNPASGIYIGKQEKKVVANPLSAEQLDALYQKLETFLDNKPATNKSVEQNKFSQLRFKLITLFMIYQSLDTGEQSIGLARIANDTNKQLSSNDTC